MDKVNIKSKNGNNLSCYIAKPEDPIGLIVCSQGFGSNKDKPTYQNLLKDLPKLGFITIVFEFQGLGESEGKLKEKTTSRDIEDLKAVIDYAFKNFKFDKEKFFVFGSSFGGFTALNIALEDKRIKGLVLKCPVSDFEDNYHPSRHLRKDTVDVVDFYEDGKNIDLYSKISGLDIPVKIIHGDKDQSVSVEQSKKLAKLLPNAELMIMEGEGHKFENKKQEVHEKMIKLFEELKP